MKNLIVLVLSLFCIAGCVSKRVPLREKRAVKKLEKMGAATDRILNVYPHLKKKTQIRDTIIIKIDSITDTVTVIPDINEDFLKSYDSVLYNSLQDTIIIKELKTKLKTLLKTIPVYKDTTLIKQDTLTLHTKDSSYVEIPFSVKIEMLNGSVKVTYNFSSLKSKMSILVNKYAYPEEKKGNDNMTIILILIAIIAVQLVFILINRKKSGL